MPRIPCPVIYEMFETGQAKDLQGQVHKFDQGIHLSYAEALYGAVLNMKPQLIIEVGLACGTSSLAMLTALKEIGQGGRVISIDPGQSTYWHSCGVANIQRAGFAPQHRLIEDYDYNALPLLLKEGCKADFGYIDGWHTFDYALLDFFYIDKMLKKGGAVAFNDSGYRAVLRVIRFVLGHRKYQEFDVGLPRTYTSKYPGGALIKRLTGRSNPDRYFRKLEDWEPHFQFYAPF